MTFRFFFHSDTYQTALATTSPSRAASCKLEDLTLTTYTELHKRIVGHPVTHGMIGSTALLALSGLPDFMSLVTEPSKNKGHWATVFGTWLWSDLALEQKFINPNHILLFASDGTTALLQVTP